jgi:hypothetical protein
MSAAPPDVAGQACLAGGRGGRGHAGVRAWRGSSAWCDGRAVYQAGGRRRAGRRAGWRRRACGRARKRRRPVGSDSDWRGEGRGRRHCCRRECAASRAAGAERKGRAGRVGRAGRGGTGEGGREGAPVSEKKLLLMAF